MTPPPLETQLVFPRRILDEAVQLALQRMELRNLSCGMVWGPLHPVEAPDRMQLLVGRPFAPLVLHNPPEVEDALVMLLLSPEVHHLPGEVRSLLQAWKRAWRVVLHLGIASGSGHLVLAQYRPGETRSAPVEALALPGVEMLSLRMDPQPPAPAPYPFDPAVRWSRTIGVLGWPVWERLVSLRFGIVGCGRLGSTMAAELARVGVQHLHLFDLDTIDLHNLGEGSLLNEDELGLAKTKALQYHIRQVAPWIEVQAWPASITRRQSWQVARTCDVLVCCADDPAARLATAMLASLYHLPLLDVGTGIFPSDTRPEQGADIRLVLPGDGCLMCLGGVPDLPLACQRLLRAEAESRFQQQREGLLERAGSLRSLNLIAAGHALQLLESLLAGTCQTSTWLHLSWEHGTVHPHYGQATPTGDCLCALSGRGPAGIEVGYRWLQRRA
jgi:hypothetical protein